MTSDNRFGYMNIRDLMPLESMSKLTDIIQQGMTSEDSLRWLH